MLSSVYDDVMNRIASQNDEDARKLAKTTLLWIAYTRQRLTGQQLQYAVAIDLEATELGEDELADLDHLCSLSTEKVKR